ncbi:hypothetical protein [Plantactinospora sp. CA-290183]|uniref:hypothetical protein n=1 Tax=Plantactinospora sp. CA-290183 TaxID=3240006 RepID=UPI003D8B0347
MDFGPGRREASFADLAGALGPGPTILEPIFDGARDDLLRRPVAEHIAGWAADLRDRGRPVVGLLGYCAGAALACGLADELAYSAAVEAPVVVLLDPLVIDSAGLYANFETAVESFADVVDPDEMAGVRAEALAAARAPGALDDPATTVATIAAGYERVVTASSDLLGLDDELAEQFTDYFELYLSYLALAAQAGVKGSRPPRTVVLTSAEHTAPDGWAADEVFGVSREDLLADPAVAVAVARCLTGRS